MILRTITQQILLLILQTSKTVLLESIFTIDGVPNWLLRDFAPYLSQPLAAIFNASIHLGYVPPVWKSAEVIPAPKLHRPRSVQTDLRPISLIPSLAKVLESIIGQWLLPVLEPALDPNQFGCRRHHSCTSCYDPYMAVCT